METGLDRAARAAAELNGWTDAIIIDLEDLAAQGPSGPPILAVDVEGTFGVDDAKDIAALVGAGRSVRVVTSSPPPGSVTGWLPTNEHVIMADQASTAVADEDIDPKVALEHLGRAEAERRGWVDAQIISPADLDSEGPVGSPLIVACEATELSSEGAQAIAALRGTGRAVLIVTNDQLAPPLLDWLPPDAIHVRDDPFPPSATEPQVEHVTEQLNDGRHVESWRRYGALHREDGPAVTITGFMGKVDVQEWHENGLLHRLDGPARITYWPSGDVQSSEWYEHGGRHRLGAPAVVSLQRNGAMVSSTWYFDDAEVAPGYQPPPPPSEVPEPPAPNQQAHEPRHTPNVQRPLEPAYCSFAQAGAELNAWWQQVLGARDALVADHSWSGGYPNPGTWVGSWWVTNDGIVTPVITYPVDRDPVDGSAIGPYLSMSTPLGLSVVCPTLDLFSPDSPAQAAFASLVMKWSEQPPPEKVRGLFRSRKQREQPPPLSASECMPLAAGNPPLRRLVQVDSLTVTRHEPSPIAEDVQLADDQAAVWLQYLLPTSDYDVLRRCAGTAIAAMGNVHRVLADPDSTLNGRRDPSEADQLRDLMRQLLLEPYANVARRAFTHRQRQLKEVAKGLAGDEWNEAEYDVLDLVEVPLGPRPPAPNTWPA